MNNVVDFQPNDDLERDKLVEALVAYFKKLPIDPLFTQEEEIISLLEEAFQKVFRLRNTDNLGKTIGEVTLDGLIVTSLREARDFLEDNVLDYLAGAARPIVRDDGIVTLAAINEVIGYISAHDEQDEIDREWKRKGRADR